MKAHLVELDIAWHDRKENVARVRRLLDGAGVARGDLVVLPEMFDTGFSFETVVTIDAGGETLGFVSGLATELGAWVAAGRSVASGDRALNVMTCVDAEGKTVCEYAKIHPFSIGGEDERFDAGKEVRSFAWGGLRVVPTICYDLRFPELYRLGVLAGGEAFIVAANWPESRQSHWRALLIARAIENQAYVLGVNRCGSDPRLRYLGGTIVVSPRGEVVAETTGEAVCPGRVLSVEIDADEVRTWRRKFPALRDIRLLGEAMR